MNNPQFNFEGQFEALTKIAWEDAVQELGMAVSTVASEKTGKCCLSATCFTNSSAVVSLVFQGHDLLKIANINSQQEALFRY